MLGGGVSEEGPRMNIAIAANSMAWLSCMVGGVLLGAGATPGSARRLAGGFRG